MSDELGFAESIKSAITAKRKHEADEKAAADERKKRRQDACSRAQQVRDEVIIPMLRKMKSDCENEDLIRWRDVQSDGNIDTFSGELENSEGAPSPAVCLKCVATVEKDSEQLTLSVNGECVMLMDTSGGRRAETLHPQENTKRVSALEPDLNGIRNWYHTTLKKCLERYIVIAPQR